MEHELVDKIEQYIRSKHLYEDLDDARKDNVKNALHIIKKTMNPLESAIEAGMAKDITRLCEEIGKAIDDIKYFYSGK